MLTPWFARADRNLLARAIRPDNLAHDDFEGHKARAEKAIRISWFMLTFGVVRMFFWIGLALMYFLGPHIGISHMDALFGSVVFVSMISLYANGATDYDQVTSAWAAIHAARGTLQAIETAERAAAIKAELQGR
jgi:hypothetical protein